MDARLRLVDGRRLSRLRRDDLADVAKAICGYERGLVWVERVYSKYRAYYRFRAKGFLVRILASDYAKILPYIKDGTLDPAQYPMAQGATRPESIEVTFHLGYRSNQFVNTDPVCRDVLTIDQWDPVFYQKVYGYLLTLFPESYPTSDW